MINVTKIEQKRFALKTDAIKVKRLLSHYGFKSEVVKPSGRYYWRIIFN